MQGLGEAAGTLVRHLLVGDDADRLRCFARRQRQAGGSAAARYGVAAGLLAGNVAFALTGGMDGGQRGGTFVQPALPFLIFAGVLDVLADLVVTGKDLGMTGGRQQGRSQQGGEKGLAQGRTAGGRR